MQNNSSSLSRSKSSSSSDSNISNRNRFGSHGSPYVFKNKDFKRPNHRRIIQRDNRFFSKKGSRIKRKTKVRAISVKKLKIHEVPLQKSISKSPFLACSWENFNKGRTQYQDHNTNISLVESEVQEENPIFSSMEITDIDEQIDFSILSEGSDRQKQLFKDFDERVDAQGQCNSITQDLEKLQLGSYEPVEMEDENIKENNVPILGSQYSDISYPEKIQKLRRSTFDGGSQEQKDEQLENE